MFHKKKGSAQPKGEHKFAKNYVLWKNEVKAIQRLQKFLEII